ncbi:SMI1/KNR4 family protein [Paenibacillus sp. N5-1-1-5]|uniref:SMI1/KNR4 family protein n=2 Tax=Paenibacillus radicis (ex Xue et al. 2023) TaxID=2972489 RepID=A0ABT1YCH3_9BACL|nr:SMI1/KNR4 family protein [Paenibacillus radicis (ex Xue et al. 2023)]
MKGSRPLWPKHVVLISGDGHWWIALDYRDRKEEPPVIYIESDGGTTFELAKNFNSFLVGLCHWGYED